MLMYIIPIVVVVLIVVFMMPIMQKQAKAIQGQMEAIRDMDVHLSVYAGNVRSINGVAEAEFKKAGTYYGCDAGKLEIELIPNFVYADTHYKGSSPMMIEIDAKKGGSYELGFSAKEPKNEEGIISCTPIVNKEIIFKTTFYITVKDVTGTKDANIMRGIM